MLSLSELSTRFPVFAQFTSSSLPIHGSHRGGRHWGKENTLETYRQAVNEARTDILEIDIWKTDDEHLVINHDGIIDGINVNQSTLQQLQKLDPQLVTLDQVLIEFTPILSIVFFFDMKDTKAIPLTLDAIKRYNIENRVIFGAVNRTINKELQKHKFSSIPICADIETMMKISQDYKQGKLDENYIYEHDILGFFVEPHTRAMLTQHLIDTIHKAGKPLALVGSLLDDPKVQQEMIQLGIDILFTDRPDILRQTFDSFKNK
ncbi:unnamed protein product [Rotaria magnacalcarata]|uniref:GP-PDE domain-containing protein n=1 Tax=Rotaria magnacalcarata TaxID=392030 RepID=A0A816WFN8_9BILA|nr:unnamed protein product [Rotaria magnacalcarata]CAF1332436.1 unnamed protein product [Rotaria magnacalcarata]CAF2054523.1 unnamed protein product [Rotaria magnacalcarata]CAF2132986.1 unnamed protein product [Rotaria magnacalcarata]CAF2252302.1 unnamed protein product [Rotaria magnacalcarata]